MRSDTNGPLTAFLLFVPLVAVPLLAVFGIPQFAPVVASPGADAVVELDSRVVEGDSPRNSSDTWNDPFHLPEQPVRREPEHSVVAVSDAPWTPPADALDEWKPDSVVAPETGPDGSRPRVRANFDEQHQLDPDGTRSVDDRLNIRRGSVTDQPERQRGRDARPIDRHPDAFLPITDSQRQPDRDDRRRSPLADDPFAEPDKAVGRSINPFAERTQSELSEFDGRPARFVKDESVRSDARSRGGQSAGDASDQFPPEGPLTWRSAVRRLNELGIRHFQLEPGERDAFHFSCFFTPSDNPRITHRFEAEATEPLRAVEKVLAQVEQWLEKR